MFESELQRSLKRYGFDKPWGVRYYWVVANLVVWPLALLFGATAWWFVEQRQQAQAWSLAALGPAIAAILLTYQQWRAARAETSLDKFYDRLNIANQHMMAYPLVRGIYPDWDERAVHVYIDLDTLENAVEKYRIGFMSDEIALRVADTFRARCIASPEYRRIARRILERPFSSYMNRTRTAARNILESAEQLQAPNSASDSPFHRGHDGNLAGAVLLVEQFNDAVAAQAAPLVQQNRNLVQQNTARAEEIGRLKARVEELKRSRDKSKAWWRF